MNIGKLKIECDSIDDVSVSFCINVASLEVTLDDVDGAKLMRQIVKQCDPENLLDYFKDDDIREYIDNRPKKSPREQYEALSDNDEQEEMTSEKYAKEASDDHFTSEQFNHGL